MTNLNETLLDDLLGKLESVRTWSPRVISKPSSAPKLSRLTKALASKDITFLFPDALYDCI
jgi:hypothetical protein